MGVAREEMLESEPFFWGGDHRRNIRRRRWERRLLKEDPRLAECSSSAVGNSNELKKQRSPRRRHIGQGVGCVWGEEGGRRLLSISAREQRFHAGKDWAPQAKNIHPCHRAVESPQTTLGGTHTRARVVRRPLR